MLTKPYVHFSPYGIHDKAEREGTDALSLLRKEIKWLQNKMRKHPRSHRNRMNYTWLREARDYRDELADRYAECCGQQV